MATVAAFVEQRAAAVTGAPREKPLVEAEWQIIKSQFPKEFNGRGWLVSRAGSRRGQATMGDVLQLALFSEPSPGSAGGGHHGARPTLGA